MRKPTKKIKIGNIFIGGDSPIAIQSMTNTKTADIAATVNQINLLTDEGCDIIRVSVDTENEAWAIKEIKKNITIPLVADIQENYRLALISIESGADKIRINPKYIGDRNKVKEIVAAALERDIPIRVGVNSGSIKPEFLLKYQDKNNGVCAESLVESA